MTRQGLDDVPARVQVRAVSQSSPSESVAELQRLSVDERARHDSLRREQDRAAYLAAHLLVREVAAALLGAEARELTVVQSCPGCGAVGHGAPTILEAPDTGVSWTHTDGHVAAVAVQGRSCGIDAELAPDPAEFHAPAGALTAEEADWVGRQSDPSIAFARLWTRKESLVKCGVMSLDDVVRTSFVVDGEVTTHRQDVRFHEQPTPTAVDERLVVTWAVGQPLIAK